jgi:peptide/nickel transport system ATP-binding protein
VTAVLSIRDLQVALDSDGGPLAMLDGVDLSIGRGEILGIVGESGAGKSTLGSAVIGLLPPAARVLGGEIRLGDTRLDQLPDHAMRRIRGRRIGMVFQNPLTSLNPLFSIGDQITETIRAHAEVGHAEAHQTALSLLRSVGIAEPQRRFHDYPHQFSGGMRQRVVIALAICGNPELIIADEPTSALDVSLQGQIIRLLKDYCRMRGAGMMLISHDIGVIAEAADRVGVLYAGRLVELGPVRDVLGNPRHPYTVGLIGCMPRIGKRPRRLAVVPGLMPKLGAPPAACAFQPRCPRAVAACAALRPDLERIGQSEVACWLARPTVGEPV